MRFCRRLGARVALLVVASLQLLPAQAVELGPLTVHSALYAPFYAELAIGRYQLIEGAAPVVSLASPVEHEAAGIAFDPVLKDFSVRFAGSGSERQLLIRSEIPVTAPFLRFLLYADAPTGRVSRVYTALLDPPDYDPAPVAVAVTANTEDSATLFSGEIYGPVAQGDTLTWIARRIKAPANITLQQRMVALVKDNAAAFIDGNMNLLRQGASLHIPSERLMSAVSQEQAAVEYGTQLSQWLEYRMDNSLNRATEVSWVPLVEEPAATTTAAAAGGSTAGYVLRIVQSTAATGSGTAATALAATPVEATALALPNPEVERLGQRLQLVEESLASKALENEQLTRQVVLLEEQLDKTARLIKLQETQLALAQQQLEAVLAAKDLASESDQMPAQATQTVVAAASQQTRQVAVVDPGATGVPDGQSESQPAVTAATTESPSNVAAQSATQEATVTATSQQTEQVAAAVPTLPEGPWHEHLAEWAVWSLDQTKQFFSWAIVAIKDLSLPVLETITQLAPVAFDAGSQSVLLSMAGVLLLVLLLVIMRRRRPLEPRLGREESVPEQIAREPAITEPGYGASTGRGDPLPEESVGAGFVTEMETTQGVAVHSEDVDPLAEAEIYLAYGRDEQAEQTLQEAIRQAPERNELKLKLLEVLQALGDTERFDILAKELSAILDPDSADWMYVGTLGRVVNPSNPLYRGGPTPTPTPTPTPVGVDLPAKPVDVLSSGSDAAPAAKVGIDEGIPFELEDGDGTVSIVPAPEVVAGTPATKVLDEGIDFEVSLPGEEVVEVADPMSVGNPAVATNEASTDALQLELSTQLDLASAYFDMGDPEAAGELLREVERRGDAGLRERAKALLDKISET
ncbi:MAG: FimV/HubP family polar landmark protein [Arenicellales bacterium]|nr:FimV/HubP family polar landmark protein [Arenicellales bacterium]